MALFESREENKDTLISSIGQTILGMIKAPLDFTEEIVKTPFNFVSDTIGGVTTKVVLIAGLAIVGLYVIGKYNILGQVGKLK